MLSALVKVNPDMVDALEKAGLRFVGKDETGRRMEVISASLPIQNDSHIVIFLV